MKLTYKPTLVFAMKEEAQEVFDSYDVLYTGIGKVNAVHALMRRIREDKPELVVNLGTAGSSKFPGGSVVNCTSFVQRDMDVTPLGMELYKTPFSDDPVQLDYGIALEDMPQAICGSGDNFDVSGKAERFDVVDMEGYALALVCKREGIPFLCLKYISDGADETADKDWNETLHHAAEVLRAALPGFA